MASGMPSGRQYSTVPVSSSVEAAVPVMPSPAATVPAAPAASTSSSTGNSTIHADTRRSVDGLGCARRRATTRKPKTAMTCNAAAT